MESRERLAPPSPALPSFHKASSSTNSSPAPTHTLPTQYSPAPSPEGSNPLTFCSLSLQMKGDERSNISVNPAFGHHTSSSSCLEFGGLGSLGLSTLAAQPQFGIFPDWWRPSEAHTTGASAFFPPFLSLYPAFVSTFNSLNPLDPQSHISVSVGMNGAINGGSTLSPTVNSTVNFSSYPAKENKTGAQNKRDQNQKNIQESMKLHQQIFQKTKPTKIPPETSSTSGCLSGSESSSDGEECSSGPDDMEEEDKDDRSNESDDSDSEEETPVKKKVKRLTHSTSESKKRRPCVSDGSITQLNHCRSVPVTYSYHLQSSSHLAGPPKSTAPLPQSARTLEEGGQQHISVIQTTGLSLRNGSSTRSHREASPLLMKSSSNSISVPSSSKHLVDPTPSKQNFAASSHKPLALCSTKKTFSSCSSYKYPPLGSSSHFSISSLSKPRTPLASKESLYNPKFFMPPEKLAPSVSSMKESCGNLPGEGSSHPNTLKQKSVKQTSSARPKNQICSDTKLLTNFHPKEDNYSAVQDAPLALITKPRSQSSAPNTRPPLAATRPSYLMPIYLSTGTKEMSRSSDSSFKSSASSGLPAGSKKAARNCVSDFHSSKDSEDSFGDNDDDGDDEDDIEDEDSGSSLSDSDSNLESDSSGSEADIKECVKTQVDSDADRIPLKPAEASSHKSSFNRSANCSVLNLQGSRPQGPLRGGLPNPITSIGALNYNCNPSPSFTPGTIAGSGRRRRVTDERVLQLPLEFGWRRETQVRTVAGRLQGEVAYFAPCGKKLRQYPDVMKYLVRNGITEISRDNFSFSTKIKVGDFYEAREGQQGLEWCLLAEDEIATCIIAMDGRRSRRPKSAHQLPGDSFGARHPHPVNLGENNFQDVNDSKLLRKLEAQEIARQAAQIKMMRKLEKQATAQAAKEARRQQAIIAAEERRKKREEMKILKQQEKIKRIQQIRMEKELRAQQILEAKRKKKEAAANAKILEAEKRNKEKEMRRLQAVILKHQELERHRLDMERERRKHHMVLMKAVEARKKAEVKERLRQEKKDEKRLNKERKLELRRLELEKAKELKKPNEDMFLADHKPLPELSRIPGLVLPGSTFSDCLMVLQFLRSFGKVLRLDLHAEIFSIIKLQEGLLNIGDSMHKVQDLLVSMLSAAVCDPGIPAGHKSKTILGDHLTSVEINRDNMSEILQMYMEGFSDQTEVAALATSLKTKAFQAHSPSQKASMLAFLVNELCCSKAVISEIDKNIDCMTNLRKDKWVVEGKLRKLRSIHAKTTGKRDGCVGGEDNLTFGPPAVRNKGKRKDGDSEEEEDEDDDSEEQGDDDEEEEEDSGGKKGKKAEMCEEEDDGANSASIEELEKQIEKACKLQSQIRQKLFDSSHSLRSMMIGEDRYKRRYWVLPQCGGIFVEGMENGEGYENVVEEKRQTASRMIRLKEENQEEARKPAVSIPAQSRDIYKRRPVCQQDNLFLQKPSSLSKLSKLLDVAKMAHDSDMSAQKIYTGEVPAMAFYPSYPTSQTDKTDASISSLLSAAQLKHSLWMTHSPKSILHYDQLSKILTENSSEWFSLLPRSPCDGSSVTSGSSPPASSSSPQPIRTKSPSFLFSNPTATEIYNTTTGINSSQSHIPKQVKSGIHQSRLTLSDVFSSGTSPSLPISGTSLPSQHAEGNGNKVHCLADTNSVNKSETPEPQSDKSSCASFPAVESAKTQDYPCPQPIPEEMLHGWWRVSDMENLHSLVKTLHSRGIRERALQKQIQKHLEHATQLCANSKDEFDVTELEKLEVSRETLETWCVEQQAMEVDIGLLQQVEALERKVVSASLQVKGWMPPEPQSDSKNLVYHEHKLSSLLTLENKGQKETSQEEFQGSVVRRPNNPLDIAVSRLLELERNIEQSNEEGVAPRMRLWHKALSQVRSSAQLSLCIQQLQKSIAWERAIMRVHCQLCQKGDNEELLLLCDGCDKGCHTYCHNPKITTVPDGDWFCHSCAAKESNQTPHSRKQQSRTAAGGKKCEVKRDSKPSVVGEFISEENASSNNMSRKNTKEIKKRKGDYCSQARNDSPVSSAKKAKTSRDGNNALAMCRMLLAELEAHQDAWPFLTPVNLKTVPGYRKVIKKPMDFSTIKEKLINNLYLNLETFIIDVNLVFDNCEKFNEDDSEIGRAGHNMRRFFDQRWSELLQ
ncbi:bromodomain adjacent to zinc finger domain protein 2B isoform X2 [Melanotaenia boesemani]|uniref:bromodomain adjacent to zinc finger domain protein 2B isoform X2 n=1 Tax=Melanotaenia boesemani TaxID=1250792 RepID=UPI001C0412CF|nr:bromodomain adjacent to zinc finger domain protein 2B isoform X2 [Melanotaenia boesemani]